MERHDGLRVSVSEIKLLGLDDWPVEGDPAISSFRGREDAHAINGTEHEEHGPGSVKLG